MSTKDPKLKRSSNLIKPGLKDRRDVELTFLKKLNEDFPALRLPGGSDKRGRTASDNDNDLHFNGTDSPKKSRSRSTQRKSQTVNPSSLAATTTSNNSNSDNSRMDNSNNQSNNNNHGTSKNNNERFGYSITNNAIAFAIDQPLPSIKLVCEPKVKDQKEGAQKIKELFRLITNDFKQINPKHNDIIGFESWYLNYNGDLICVTRDIELFVFLCDSKHIPDTLLNTRITPVLPKHLPAQRSVIIKGVPNVMNIEDFKLEIISKYSSVYCIEEILGTNNGKTRYIRIDILNSSEHNQLLNSGIICIEGQCLHVIEYLAAPRVLICSMCNLPGHNKKQCRFTFERCKRCGENRENGDHIECAIMCHNCKGEHVSTDFRCPAIQDYRRELIQHLQQHPDSLPDDVQLFIPSKYRQLGAKMLGNRRCFTQQGHYPAKQNNDNTYDEWPSLPPSSHDTIANYKVYKPHSSDAVNNLQIHLNKLEKECALAKVDYERRNNEIKSQMSASILQIQSLIVCFSSVIQRQNETISILKSSINECLEVNKMTNQALCLIMAKSGDQQYEGIIKQLSTIPIAERQAALDKIFSTFSPLIDEITMKIIDVTKYLQPPNV
jgi:hypothetical protein